MTELDRCDCTAIHQVVVDRVKGKMPEEERLYDLAELFKVFGDTTRIRILWALTEEEMCVCDIAVALEMSQPAISAQLRVLKRNDFVTFRKAGKIVYYTLKDEHIKTIIAQSLDHIKE